MHFVSLWHNLAIFDSLVGGTLFMISFDRLHLKESFGSHTIVNGTFDHLYHEQDGQHLLSFCHQKTFKPSAEATFVNIVI